MKKIGFLFHMALASLLIACESELPSEDALFDEFRYSGNDSRYPQANVSGSTSYYLNPVLAGCYPDPSICRKDSDYYMANSSFVYFPGIPVWHSTNLFDWEQVGYALDRPSQLKFNKVLPITAGIYAPDISYNPYNGTFYLITTGVFCGGTFMVHTQDPRQGWSDPVFIPEVGGIDPSFLFDTDGKTYIVNNDAPEGKAEYDGHRAIWLREFDLTNNCVIGNAIPIVDKGVHPDNRPIWIEGPHLYHIGGTYYLIAAEGGTSDWHSEVVFSASSVYGPYRPCAINPILTQRMLDRNRPNPVTCAGHADMVDTPDGQWWAVFLGMCPYEADRYCNTGRSTFLLPVSWTEGQPLILEKGKIIPTQLAERKSASTIPPTTGNFSIYDSFEDSVLNLRWMQLRTTDTQWRSLSNGKLVLKKLPVSLNDPQPASFLCQWIKHASFTSTIQLLFTPLTTDEMAGITCYMSQNSYFSLGKTLDKDGKPILSLISRNHGKSNLAATVPLKGKAARGKLYLKVEADKANYTFSFSTNGRNWTQVGDVQDSRILSTAVAEGFTGSVIGLFATSNK